MGHAHRLRDPRRIARRVLSLPGGLRDGERLLGHARRDGREEHGHVEVVARADVDVRPGLLVDGHAQAAQVVGVGAHRVEAAAVRAEDASVRPQGDAEVLEALVAARARRRRRQDVERELEVGRTARERPGDAEWRR